MTVSKVEVSDNLKNSIKKSIDLIGGIEKFIKKGDIVLVKPNFNTSDPFPASTDTKFLKEVIELIYEAGAKLITIGESCTLYRNTRKEMEKVGVFELEKQKLAPKIHVFEEHGWIKREIPEGKFLKKVSLPKILDNIDKLILLPCLKTHKYAQFTGSLKLSVGFMKPIERISLHVNHLEEKIADLNKVIHPNLIIMDGRKCFINQGPTHGEVKEPNIILASENRVDLDIEGVRIIKSYKGNSLSKIEPEEIKHIKLSS